MFLDERSLRVLGRRWDFVPLKTGTVFHSLGVGFKFLQDDEVDKLDYRSQTPRGEIRDTS